YHLPTPRPLAVRPPAAWHPWEQAWSFGWRVSRNWSRRTVDRVAATGEILGGLLGVVTGATILCIEPRLIQADPEPRRGRPRRGTLSRGSSNPSKSSWLRRSGSRTSTGDQTLKRMFSTSPSSTTYVFP